MNVDSIYSLIKYIIRKNQNGNLLPQDFNNLINTAQNSYMNYLLGEFQKYIPGRPIAPATFGQNEDIRQRLTPFITTPVSLTINAFGVSPYPNDFQAADAMYYGQYNRRVKFIQQDRLDSHYNSVINPISNNPVYLLIQEGLQFYPTNLGAAKFSYIRTPTQIIWGYTLDNYGRPIYNAATSSDPAWYDLDMLDIIVRALAMIGVNLQIRDLEQYSQQIKQFGQ